MRYVLFFFPVIFAFTVAAFAGEPAPDSLGVIGTSVVDALSKIKIIGPFAQSLYFLAATALGYVLTLTIQALLKKIPTKWKWSAKLQDVSVSFFWRLLARLFGKSILYYHAKAEQDFEKERTKRKLKEHLKRHDPLLSIDIDELMKN